MGGVLSIAAVSRSEKNFVVRIYQSVHGQWGSAGSWEKFFRKGMAIFHGKCSGRMSVRGNFSRMGVCILMQDYSCMYVSRLRLGPPWLTHTHTDSFWTVIY